MEVTHEEIEKSLQNSKDTVAAMLVHDYKKVDMTNIAKRLAEGDLIEAYVGVLNMEAELLGQGGSYNSDEYKEIKSMKQQCEHWIAQRVLKLSGWKEISTVKYIKRGG